METIVISLGGSMIIPEEIDVAFLKDFKNLILEHVARGKKFLIITGGGKICRKYNAAAMELGNPTDADLDWIGIAALRLNAELLRAIFGANAHSEVVNNLSQKFSFDKPVVIGAAYGPGRSSDWNAVEGAKSVGAKKIINLSNVDYVYDADPKTNPNAKKLDKISWAEYRSIIPDVWTAGLSSPFDPIASKDAQGSGISVMIMNGKPIENLANYLNGENFLGTIIS